MFEWIANRYMKMAWFGKTVWFLILLNAAHSLFYPKPFRFENFKTLGDILSDKESKSPHGWRYPEYAAELDYKLAASAVIGKKAASYLGYEQNSNAAIVGGIHAMGLAILD